MIISDKKRREKIAHLSRLLLIQQFFSLQVLQQQQQQQHYSIRVT